MGPSTQFKKRVETLCQSSARNTFEKNENLRREYFEKKVVVYENIINVEDLNELNAGFLELVQAQQWEVVLMTTQEIKVGHKF